MSYRQILALGATALGLSTLPSHAGPCTREIELLSDRLRVVEETPTAPESRDARLHRQPTAGSVTAAENSLRALYDTKGAALALARARDADRSNDAAACARAIAEARRGLALKPETDTGSK
jgi:hypothetical protein